MTILKRYFQRSVACVCMILLVSTAQLWAAGPGSEELKREAFTRGGSAIAAALNATAETESVVSEAVRRAVPPSPPAAAPPPQLTGGGLHKGVLVGLVAGFVVSGALIYKFATGPGASVRNCSTCK